MCGRTSSCLRQRLAKGLLPLPLAVLFETLVKTGTRPGEAFALQPADVNLGRGNLHVERSLELKHAPREAHEDLRAKGCQSFRRTGLATPELPLLASGRSARRGWGEPAWLFPSDAGTGLDHNNVAKVFRLLVKRAGLSRFRLYDLRHTFATTLISEGAPLNYLARQLGHRNATTTLKHYVRWVPTERRRFVDALDGRQEESGSKKRRCGSSRGWGRLR